MWKCESMKPGTTRLPAASMTRRRHASSGSTERYVPVDDPDVGEVGQAAQLGAADDQVVSHGFFSCRFPALKPCCCSAQATCALPAKTLATRGSSPRRAHLAVKTSKTIRDRLSYAVIELFPS